MSTLIGRLLVGTRLDSKGFEDGARKSTKHLKNFDRRVNSIGKSINSSLARFGAAFAVGSLISNAARTVADFDQKVANLAATTGQSRSQMGALVENAKDIGAVSAFSASQVLDLQTELAKLGNTESEIISMTKSVGDFSIAVGASTSDAAALAGGVLKSFGKSAKDTESVVSSLAVATTKSALDFNKLSVALPIVGTAADQSGVSLERTTSLLGVLADRNIDASTSGTALRNIFLDLKSRGLTFNEAMSQINNSTDKLNTANQLFGKRGAVVATVLAESSVQAQTLEASITGVNGALDKMTKERLDTLNGQLTLVRSSWQGFILELDKGDSLISKRLKETLDSTGGLFAGLTQALKGGLVNDRENGLKNFFAIAYGGEDVRKKVIADLEKARTLQKAIKDGVIDDQGFRTSRASGFATSLQNNEIEKIDPLAQKIAELNQGLDDTGTKTAKVVSLADTIRNLEADITQLSESYIKGGSSNDNIIDSIVSKQAQIVSLNTELQKSVALVNQLERGDQSVQGVSALPTPGLPSSIQSQSDKKVQLGDGFLKKAKADTEALRLSNEALESSYTTLGQAIGDSLAQGANSFKDFASNALKSIQKTIGGLIRLFVANALASTLGTGPLALFAAPALAGLAEGIFNTAINSLTVPALANGGVISKPTYALLGEYPGAANNPEIAAPEKKLRNIFRGELGNVSASSGGTTKYMGGDIYKANKRARYTVGRTG